MLSLLTSETSHKRSKVKLRVESLEAREVPASLYIGDHHVLNNKTDYLTYIKYLTVPEEKQTGDVFNSSNVAAIKKLEDPLRRQIFTSMYYAPHRTFNFPDLDAAEQNVELRVETVNFMNMVSRQANPAVNTLGLDFNYFSDSEPPTANPAYWTRVPAPAGSPNPSREFRYTGHDSYSAIMSIPDAPYRGECFGTLQIAILYSAAKVLGQAEFNAIFPNGLIFGTVENSTPLSIYQLLPSGQMYFEGGPINLGRANMVPGDFVYMKNNDNYQSASPTGYWAGENAIYMGRYNSILNGRPVYNSAAPGRFTGLGADDKTEREMRWEVWKAYCVDVLGYSKYTPFNHLPAPKGVRWTVVAGPGASDY
jgi:hypothetical protein